MKHLTEAQTEKFLKKHPPIGCLAEKHPVFQFGVVCRVEGKLFALFMGNLGELPADAKIHTWGAK